LGNTGTITVNGNLSPGGNMTLNAPSRSIAQINAGESGSNVVSIQNNVLQGTFNYNGPVSCSSHVFSSNNIIGGQTFNFQSQSRGLTFQNNYINGSTIWNDNTVFAPTLGSNNTFSNNNVNGTATFTNAGSSSFNISNNNLNTVAVTSFLDASAVTTANNRTYTLNANAVFGNLNSILFSGSMGAAPTARTLGSNLIAGQFISASLIGDGSGSNMIGTAILGGGLNVIGTTTIPAVGIQQNVGSAFFGRWNATDGNRASTAQTILAVGTGVSGSTGIVRKTGFLIDSGSNSFFEGSLNVSGSTILSGSTFINNLQNGITDNIVTYNTTTGELRKASLADITSASFDAAEFWSTTTQSGSAGVSGSITFNNSGSVAGISVANNSQITLSQAGTYNIQFSAQLETSAGADTVYLWFKKNGVNITDSASKAVLTNNTAQIMTVNILDVGVANDYYELAYQTTNGHATVLYEAASGNIPAIPSVILTVTQIR
jgi:hypothetical protein